MEHFPGLHLEYPVLLHIAISNGSGVMVFTYPFPLIGFVFVAEENIVHQLKLMRQIGILVALTKEFQPDFILHLGHRLEVDDLVVFLFELGLDVREQDFILPTLSSVTVFLHTKAFLEALVAVEIKV